MKKILAFVWCCTVAVSCEEETAVTGTLVGRVGAVMNEFGKLIDDRSGYEVRLEGSNPEITAHSDVEGRFIVENLAAGTFHLVFSKPGFQTIKVFSYQFNGGNVPTYYEAPLLSELSSTEITKFDAFLTEENNPDTSKYDMIKIEYEINPVSTDDEPRRVTTYIGSSDKVSGVDYLYQLNDPGFYKFSKFPAGSKLFAIAYPSPIACNPYYDPEQNLFINSCLGDPIGPIEIVLRR